MKKLFDQIPFFAISKMAKNQFLFFEVGKSLKLPEMQFHIKKFDLFDFMNFFVWTFLNFLARCVFERKKGIFRGLTLPSVSNDLKYLQAVLQANSAKYVQLTSQNWFFT